VVRNLACSRVIKPVTSSKVGRMKANGCQIGRKKGHTVTDFHKGACLISKEAWGTQHCVKEEELIERVTFAGVQMLEILI
jgi:hypothetical protein